MLVYCTRLTYLPTHPTFLKGEGGNQVSQSLIDGVEFSAVLQLPKIPFSYTSN